MIGILREYSSTVVLFLLATDITLYRWWYARDPNTGREGVIPASYLY